MIHLLRYYGGLVFGVDTEAEIAQLPTDKVEVNGTQFPVQPRSMALVGATGAAYYFSGATSTWMKVGG